MRAEIVADSARYPLAEPEEGMTVADPTTDGFPRWGQIGDHGRRRRAT